MTVTLSRVAVIFVSVLMVVSLAGGSGIAGATQGQDSASAANVDVSDLQGDGTADDPYVITTATELQAIEDDLTAHYELGDDIDASGTAEWNGGNGFVPIGGGEDSPSFNGSLDGNGYTISGLTIDRPETSWVGLFGYVDNGEIRDVTLTDATVIGANATAGGRGVGALVGEVAAGTIEGVTATVTIDGNEFVGGVIGTAKRDSESNVTTVSDVTLEGTVNGTEFVGGLIGDNNYKSTVTEAEADVTVTGTESVGGLAGLNTGTIKNVTTSSSVDGTGDIIGGLVGHNGASTGDIQNADATGAVNGSDHVGGFVGINGPTMVSGDAEIFNASASGAVDGQMHVGGLSGTNTGTIETSTASSTVDGDINVGGLVGQNGILAAAKGLVEKTKASGSVTGNENIGGLVGINLPYSTVKTSFATGAVSVAKRDGGLVGANPEDINDNGTIKQSYWDTEATGQDRSAGDYIDNVTGLTTAEMTGENALENMTELSDVVWVPQANDYPDLWVRSRDDLPDDTLGVTLSEPTITVDTETEVTVTVTDNQTGDPVEGAAVEISDLRRSGSTDTDGEATFSLNVSIAGKYPVSVTADSYDDATVTLTVESSGPSLADYAGDDGTVGIVGLQNAVEDWRESDIGIGLLSDVIVAWRTGEQVG